MSSYSEKLGSITAFVSKIALIDRLREKELALKVVKRRERFNWVQLFLCIGVMGLAIGVVGLYFAFFVQSFGILVSSTSIYLRAQEDISFQAYEEEQCVDSDLNKSVDELEKEIEQINIALKSTFKPQITPASNGQEVNYPSPLSQIQKQDKHAEEQEIAETSHAEFDHGATCINT